MGWKLLLAVQNFIVLAHCVDVSGKIYQTHAALEKENLMFCYECSTMLHGKSCNNFTDKDEYSKFSTKCTGDRKTCMVKRYSYTLSNESATTSQQLWSLERNCSGKCEEGCIVIGERIKIYACQACCETPLCNISNGSGRSASSSPLIVCLTFLFLLLRIPYYSCGPSLAPRLTDLGSPKLPLDSTTPHRRRLSPTPVTERAQLTCHLSYRPVLHRPDFIVSAE